MKKFDLEYENAGIIENGRKCWVAARFKTPMSLKYRPKDMINNRIFCLITNDGTFRNSYLSMAHRIFCNNQLKLMVKAASESGLGVMHTKNHQRKIDTNMILINDFLDSGKSFIEKADHLNDKIMSPQEAKNFLDKLMLINHFERCHEIRFRRRDVKERETIVNASDVNSCSFGLLRRQSNLLRGAFQVKVG